MVKVKICGITTLEDALFAAEAGADMLGLNFYKRSPRYLDPQQATIICDSLREQLGAACPLLVGVFVNEVVSNISAICERVGLDFAQLSGDESDSMLRELRGTAFKAIRPGSLALALEDVAYYRDYFPTDERAPSLLLDAYHPNLYGGTGHSASDEVTQAVRESVPRLMLAGGLKPENVAERVRALRPWGVDVASGVEPDNAPGVKDRQKVRDFIAAAKGG